ncbi:MAG: hypothetical protein J6Y54_07485 [Lentisphaeria bacterium]|nr:hypothetical protein [Lentisphaeria bacterium]
MKNLLLNAAAAAMAAAVAGCTVPYSQCVHTDYDDRVDEANAPFVREAAKIYEERKKFRCNLELKPAESVGVFLSNASHRQFSVAQKRDLVLLLENTLAERLAALRDFNVINRAGSAGSTDIAVTTGDAQTKNYLMTYSIVALEFNKQRKQEYDFISDKKVMRTYYSAVAKVEVSLFDPAGNTVFTFNDECAIRNRGESAGLLNEVVKAAAQKAIERYSLATTPPLYVKQTIGSGTYVQISGGGAYGIRPGMKIRFYRNVVRQTPALPGEKVEQVVHQQPVGTGTVGVNGAPVGSDDAWVYIDSGDPLSPCDFRKPEKQMERTVFVWTSAKPE